MTQVGEKHKERIMYYDQYIVAQRAKAMETFDQRGQTCGIYALAAALKTYNTSLPIIETAKEPLSFKPDPNDKSMRYLAKNKLKVTKIGELFDAKDVVTLALQYGHVAEVKKIGSFFFQQIRLIIKNNKLVMIPFYPKDNGHPDSSGGTDGAHWCIAIGYLDLPPTPKILVTHWDQFFAFDAYECQQSNANLSNFKEAYYYKTTTGGINTYSDLNDVLKLVNKSIDEGNSTPGINNPHIKIKDFANDPNKFFRNPWIKKTVNIPAVNLQLTLAKQIVII